MEFAHTIFRIPGNFFPIPIINSRKSSIHAATFSSNPQFPIPSKIKSPKRLKSLNRSISTGENDEEENIPSMTEILSAASKTQNLELRLETLGPFFRITAKSLKTQKEVGKAQGLIRVWVRGKKILHLDSIRLNKESLRMEKSIFGYGLFIGAVAIRYGYDRGCKSAELLAINDSELYHSKLVRFYSRIGFKKVHEVSGSKVGDIGHMLVWGGIGTLMEAHTHNLLIKWCSRFKSPLPNS